MAARHVNPNQLKMFMTPTEIVNTYQVLDGDREGAPRAGSYTRRSATTGGRPNVELHPDVLRHRQAQGFDLHGGTHVREYNEETDEQVWARKSWESQMDPEEYYEHRHGHSMPEMTFNVGSSAPSAPSHTGTSAWEEYEAAEHSYFERKQGEHEAADWARRSGPSIWESVRSEGVKSPVHLGNQFGSEGKRQVIGGHHRIAAALDTRPDELIPVLHHEDIWHARENKVWKYT